MTVKKEYAALDLISNFLTATEEDPRINSSHISLYASLVYFWQKNGFKSPVSFFRNELTPFCKISGTATFHKCLKELHDYGYINYAPSYNHTIGSRVDFHQKVIKNILPINKQ